jgi:hypothetical protein
LTSQETARALARLAEELREEGGLIAGAVTPIPSVAADDYLAGDRSAPSPPSLLPAEDHDAEGRAGGAAVRHPTDAGASGDGLPRPDGARRADYALLIEAIREGHLLHAAEGRVVRPQEPDLALLAGDRLYALGLDRLARLGDLAAVALLADVISAAARAQAERGAPLDAEGWAAAERLVTAADASG